MTLRACGGRPFQRTVDRPLWAPSDPFVGVCGFRLWVFMTDSVWAVLRAMLRDDDNTDTPHSGAVGIVVIISLDLSRCLVHEPSRTRSCKLYASASVCVCVNLSKGSLCVCVCTLIRVCSSGLDAHRASGWAFHRHSLGCIGCKYQVACIPCVVG